MLIDSSEFKLSAVRFLIYVRIGTTPAHDKVTRNIYVQIQILYMQLVYIK